MRGSDTRRVTRLEDYALIGDTHTAALVGRNGSIHWLCLPRFDSHACFAAVLGDERDGRWIVSPATHDYRVHRRYRANTLILETEFETKEGTVRLVDVTPLHQQYRTVVRMVEGLTREVRMQMQLILRFGRPVSRLLLLACGYVYVAGPANGSRALLKRLLELRNDVGLLAEEYDADAKRLLGNFPQAISHLSLVNRVFSLMQKSGPAQHRQGRAQATAA
jgi:GH15 family glucan-1,4-alpha-glucosidase